MDSCGALPLVSAVTTTRRRRLQGQKSDVQGVGHLRRVQVKSVLHDRRSESAWGVRQILQEMRRAGTSLLKSDHNAIYRNLDVPSSEVIATA